MAEPTRTDGPLAELEEAFVDDYLRGRGYSRALLAHMPRAAANRILAEAEAEASLLLAQIESRTHYLSSLDERHLK
jgi:predicted GNAT family acetyltransferase